MSSNKQQLPPQSIVGLGREVPDIQKKTICGLVTGIIDGNTFKMSIPDIEGSSLAEKQVKTIRIHGLDKPSVTTLPGILAKLELEKMIVGRTLECEIVDQNDSDQFIAVVPEKYLQSPFAFDIKRT